MSIWAHCIGVIEFTHFLTKPQPILGNTFTFKDMLKDDFNYPENPVPYGSEGSLQIFKNIIELNEDFNESQLYTVSGSLRDVNSIDEITKWLEKIIEENKDELCNILFEVTISPFLSCDPTIYSYFLNPDYKLIVEEK